MHSLKKIILATVGCMVMAGCTTLQQDVGDYFGSSDDGDRQVVYYSGQGGPPAPEAPDTGMSYPDMAREMSNGSVSVYSLDGPAPAPVAPPTLHGSTMPDGGVVSSVDPNVTVYPFDNGPAPETAARPALSPPSAQFRPLAAPFGGALQSPAPLGMAPAAPPVPPPVHTPGQTSSVYYKHGVSGLNSSGKEVVDYMAKSGGNIVVKGYASERAETNDPVERSIVNLKTSMDRAFKVSSELIRKGVPPSAIDTRAYGDTRRASPTDESLNRRVEIETDGTGMGAPVTISSSTAGDSAAPIPPMARY